jgi:hypothetical protein
MRDTWLRETGDDSQTVPACRWFQSAADARCTCAVPYDAEHHRSHDDETQHVGDQLAVCNDGNRVDLGVGEGSWNRAGAIEYEEQVREVDTPKQHADRG